MSTNHTQYTVTPSYSILNSSLEVKLSRSKTYL